jgi:hypothetical protein
MIIKQMVTPEQEKKMTPPITNYYGVDEGLEIGIERKIKQLPNTISTGSTGSTRQDEREKARVATELNW